MAHTPGPWVVRDGQPFVIVGPIGYALAICYNQEGMNGEPVYDRAANARLIAAAPDLLAACEAARDWLRAWFRVVTLEHFQDAEALDLDGLMGQLNSTIARARGEEDE